MTKKNMTTILNTQPSPQQIAIAPISSDFKEPSFTLPEDLPAEEKKKLKARLSDQYKELLEPSHYCNYGMGQYSLNQTQSNASSLLFKDHIPISVDDSIISLPPLRARSISLSTNLLIDLISEITKKVFDYATIHHAKYVTAQNFQRNLKLMTAISVVNEIRQGPIQWGKIKELGTFSETEEDLYTAYRSLSQSTNHKWAIIKGIISLIIEKNFKDEVASWNYRKNFKDEVASWNYRKEFQR
jgi:hypothetical protein